MKWKGEGQCLLGFRFCFRGGADNGRIVRGQREGHEEWTARRTRGGEDCHNGLLEDRGRGMRSGQRGGQREERTATMVDTKKGSIYIKRAFLIKRVVFN